MRIRLLLVKLILLCHCSSYTRAHSLQREKQQCSPPGTPGIICHLSSLDAMTVLLGSTGHIESFFESAFERTHLHVSHSQRVDRPAWMQYYRRFLPSMDLDLILSHNASVTNFTSPLLPQHDVSILRVAERAPGLLAWLPVSVPARLDSLRSAVRDGCVLQLYDMSSRSRQVAVFADALRTFWAVPVSTNLAFYPPHIAAQPSPIPTLFASDTFVIIINGNAIITLFEDYFAYPCEHHIENLNVHRSAIRNMKTSKVLDADEGDVLYVPRGTAVDVRTTDSFAISLCIEIHTEQRLVFHGLLHAVNIARRASNILDLEITANDDEQGVESSPAWSDVLATSVKIAAEFTPSMRQHLPITGDILRIMDEIGTDAGESLLRNSLDRFLRAARHALFEPMLNVLSGDDNDVGAIASSQIISWAQALQNGTGDLAGAKSTFQVCLQDLYDYAILPDIITSMSLDWYDRDELERRSGLRSREHSLKRHEQGPHNDKHCQTV